MGVYVRLFLPILIVITVVLIVRYSTLFAAETAQADARYQHGASQMTAYLHNTLLPAVNASDRSAMDQSMRNALLLNPDLMELALDYTGGHLEAHTRGVTATFLKFIFQIQ